MKRTALDPGLTGEIRKKARIHHIPAEDRFATRPLSRFAGNFPYYRQPVEVGCFSQDKHRDFKHDSSQLRRYVKPVDCNDVLFDLRAGYDCFQRRDESIKEYLELDDLLRWVSLNREKFRPKTDPPLKEEEFRLHTDFISWRGLLTRLLCTPYEGRDGWKIAATKHLGTIYLCEFDTEPKIQQKETETAMQKQMTYWGYKFEQYTTAENVPDASPKTGEPVNNNEAFCSVTRTRLKEHSLVFGGEVDCFDPAAKKEPKKCYIELKTSREITHHRQDRNFKKFKLIKWWAQSFLIGIPKIVCGFRDDEGVVHRLKDFITQDIPKDVDGAWDPVVCFNFLDQFLQWVKHVVQIDDGRSVYLFECQPRQPVTVTYHPPGTEYEFIPQWYREGRPFSETGKT